MPEALNLLKTRRSVKPIELAGPGPTAAEIDALLTVASRVPDHGKLTPWRFIVFEGDARTKASRIIGDAFRERRPDATSDQVAVESARLARAPLVIAVVSRAAPHVKIPEWEQIMSAGASATSLVMAAHAIGADHHQRAHGIHRGAAHILRARRGSGRRSRSRVLYFT